MTPEQQRIAIAEACGYKDLETQWKNYHQWECPDGRVRMGTLSDKYACLPDYLNDLNAMFSAFRYLGRHWEISQVHDGYYCRIEFGPKRKDVTVAGLELLPVMSEAFLKTLSLWKP